MTAATAPAAMMLAKISCAAAIAAAVHGCGARDGGEAADREGAAAQTLALGTFSAPPDTAEAGFAARLPADDGRSILITSTTLYPGTARLSPDIENPYRDADAIAAGERHFVAFNCAGCHAPLGGGGMGPPLSDEVWIHGSEPAQIYMSIMHGRADGMPAWSSMLPARTAWELVAYIETLSDIEDYAAERGFNLDGTRFPGSARANERPGSDAGGEIDQDGAEARQQ